jgi:hypothetical protein
MNKMIFLIIGAFIIIAVIAVMFVIAGSNKKIETQKYDLVLKKDNFEIRFYPQAILATVKMKSDYYDSRNTGFRILAGYIFGGNKENQKIAMTSPVRMSGDNNNSEMSFVLPSKMEFKNLPEPVNNDIILQESKPMVMASITFGGFASKNKIEKYKQKLIGVLDDLNMVHSDRFEYLGYNPPYQIINRKNEVQIQLINFNKDRFLQKLDK